MTVIMLITGSIVQALLENDASCLIKNRRGQLAIDFAYSLDIISRLQVAQQHQVVFMSILL